MFDDFKQLTLSDFCLTCEGCCRFRDAQSPWRARVTREDINAFDIDGGHPNLDFERMLDDNNYLKTVENNGIHFCMLFDVSGQKSCRAYASRPFECRLYPFMTVKKNGHFYLAAHRLCPYVEQNRERAFYGRYVEYLKTYFKRKDVSFFLKRNPFLLGQYQEDDFDILFPLPEQYFLRSKALIEAKDRIEKALTAKEHEVSPFSFVNLFAWSDFFSFEIKEIDGCLCIFAHDQNGCFMYLPPLGPAFSEKTVGECFDLMNTVNQNTGVSRIENVEQKDLGSLNGTYQVHKKPAEYVYDRQSIVELCGNALKSKRNSYNAFKEKYAARIVPYEDSMFQECILLYDRWMSQRMNVERDDIYCQMIKENRSVHRRVLRYYRELCLLGRVVVVDEKIGAYTFGYPLNQETFCVLFEVADLSIKGLSVFIFRELCMDSAVSAFRYINVMDDFGLANIKEAKLSYRPHHLEDSYVISQKQPK